MLDYTNRNILIIGASSGIGEETAYTLAEQGANLVLVARREDRLKQVCENAKATQIAYHVADISDIQAIEGLIKQIVAEHGKLDGLVYVAGISQGGIPLKSLSYDKQMKIFQTNYFGFIECVRQVTKRGNYNDHLRIVGVSSVSSLRGEKALVAYAASKAAMDSAIRCMAKELASKGICINSVAPSIVRTDMYTSFLEVHGDQSEANMKALERQYLGLAEMRDVANAIVFLLSQEARFITGITMPVDGGFTTT